MLKTKRNCTFAICVALLTFILFASLIAFYVFFPILRNVSSFNDLCIIPENWPFLPKWAIIVVGILPITASLWMLSVLVKIRSHIVSPFVKCDIFLEELAGNNIPPPLELKEKYGPASNRTIANLNIVRDHIINNNRRKDAAEERASEARAKLDFANELKSLLISRLTPDIRLPLNSIEGYAEILKAKTADSDIFRNELDAIARNIVGISKIVSRMISFSKLGHQQMELSLSHFRTSELISNILQSNDDLQLEREVEFINIFDSSTPPLLYTDYELLSQILLIVIRSVFRASEHGEAVSICCSADHEKVYFTIKDSAYSQCREKLAELYNFHKFDCAAEFLDGASSTLLGIFFAANLVEYIGGELIAESDKNSNNKFIVCFNRFDILSAANETELRNKGIHSSLTPTSSSNLLVGKNYLPGTFIMPAAVPDAPSRKILLGEDNADNANALKEYLELFNFQVVCCDNVHELLEWADEGDFDALILSNSLRHRNLVKVIKSLRTQFNAVRMPIIVLVSKLNPRKEAELQELKISSILLKPLQYSALVNRLNQLCSYADES